MRIQTTTENLSKQREEGWEVKKKLQKLRHSSQLSHKEFLPFFTISISYSKCVYLKKKKTAPTALGITKSTVTDRSGKGSKQGREALSSVFICIKLKNHFHRHGNRPPSSLMLFSSNLRFSTGFLNLICVGTRPFLDSSPALTGRAMPATYGFRNRLSLGCHYDVIAVGSLCFTDFRSLFTGFLVC